MAQIAVPRERKPEVRRVDSQFRVGLSRRARLALGIEVDDYVSLVIEGDTVRLKKVQI